MSKVRTNIEIEDTYVQAIMNRYRVRTKTDAVDLALWRCGARTPSQSPRPMLGLAVLHDSR